ncbi:MAG: GT4 family glycosyltransferase PelF, partial [Granulosicoccus sp.]
IGRVVPVKDIKTFIRAIQIISSRLPDVQGWIVGPDDEAPDYTRECRDLVASLGLANRLLFKGFQKPDDVFPQIGLCALTSVSEGQPLVVLEGYAAGIPSLTTDVGSCRELALGNSDADQALGQAGQIVPIADPGAFACAAIQMLSDTALWQAASESAIRRVETYYDEKTMIASYEEVYQRHLKADKSSDGSSDSAKVA